MTGTRELVFALRFRGKGRAVPGVPGAREARTTASAETLTTFVGSEWLRAQIAEGAVLEARVQRAEDGTFVEEGSITYGGAGTIRFETVSRGWYEPGVAPGTTMGAVIWRVTEGTGRFAGARGLITSSFSVSAEGDVIDDHVARIGVV